MAKSTDFLIFCAISIAITKCPKFLRLFTLFSLHFSCATNQPNELITYSFCRSVIRLLPVIHTLPIQNLTLFDTII